MNVSRFTTLINTATKQYPCSVVDMYNQNPDITFPDPIDDSRLAEFGFAVVYGKEPPIGDVVEEGTPELAEDGKWYQSWKVRTFNEEEQNNRANILRNEKKEILSRAAQEKRDQGFLVSVSVDNDEGVTNKIQCTMKFDNDDFNLQMIKTIAENSFEDTMDLMMISGEEITYTPKEVVAICVATMNKLYTFNKKVYKIEQSLNAAKTLGEVQEINISLNNI